MLIKQHLFYGRKIRPCCILFKPKYMLNIPKVYILGEIKTSKFII